eukprot:m.128571 g.128571  ORF g.128571 m.128571 type:complete len:1142 (+) comp9452_c4_seq6:1417-4842(+)
MSGVDTERSNRSKPRSHQPSSSSSSSSSELENTSHDNPNERTHAHTSSSSRGSGRRKSVRFASENTTAVSDDFDEDSMGDDNHKQRRGGNHRSSSSSRSSDESEGGDKGGTHSTRYPPRQHSHHEHHHDHNHHHHRNRHQHQKGGRSKAGSIPKHHSSSRRVEAEENSTRDSQRRSKYVNHTKLQRDQQESSVADSLDNISMKQSNFLPTPPTSRKNTRNNKSFNSNRRFSQPQSDPDRPQYQHQPATNQFKESEAFNKTGVGDERKKKSESSVALQTGITEELESALADIFQKTTMLERKASALSEAITSIYEATSLRVPKSLQHALAATENVVALPLSYGDYDTLKNANHALSSLGKSVASVGAVVIAIPKLKDDIASFRSTSQSTHNLTQATSATLQAKIQDLQKERDDMFDELKDLQSFKGKEPRQIKELKQAVNEAKAETNTLREVLEKQSHLTKSKIDELEDTIRVFEKEKKDQQQQQPLYDSIDNDPNGDPSAAKEMELLKESNFEKQRQLLEITEQLTQQLESHASFKEMSYSQIQALQLEVDALREQNAHLLERNNQNEIQLDRKASSFHGELGSEDDSEEENEEEVESGDHDEDEVDELNATREVEVTDRERMLMVRISEMEENLALAKKDTLLERSRHEEDEEKDEAAVTDADEENEDACDDESENGGQHDTGKYEETIPLNEHQQQLSNLKNQLDETHLKEMEAKTVEWQHQFEEEQGKVQKFIDDILVLEKGKEELEGALKSQQAEHDRVVENIVNERKEALAKVGEMQGEIEVHLEKIRDGDIAFKRLKIEYAELLERKSVVSHVNIQTDMTLSSISTLELDIAEVKDNEAVLKASLEEEREMRAQANEKVLSLEQNVSEAEQHLLSMSTKHEGEKQALAVFTSSLQVSLDSLLRVLSNELVDNVEDDVDETMVAPILSLGSSTHGNDKVENGAVANYYRSVLDFVDTLQSAGRKVVATLTTKLKDMDAVCVEKLEQQEEDKRKLHALISTLQTERRTVNNALESFQADNGLLQQQLSDKEGEMSKLLANMEELQQRLNKVEARASSRLPPRYGKRTVPKPATAPPKEHSSTPSSSTTTRQPANHHGLKRKQPTPPATTVILPPHSVEDDTSKQTTPTVVTLEWDKK